MFLKVTVKFETDGNEENYITPRHSVILIAISTKNSWKGLSSPAPCMVKNIEDLFRQEKSVSDPYRVETNMASVTANHVAGNAEIFKYKEIFRNIKD